MRSLKFWPGRNKRASSSSSDLLSFDLLYELSYLSGVAAAGVSRRQMFRLAGELRCTAAPYFAEVDRLVKNMNYRYSEACRLVGEAAKPVEVKSLLLRLSSALASGEPEAEFLAMEAQVQADAYANSYEGKLEALRMWTDAYTALIVSAALIVVVATISTVIYDMGVGFVSGLVVVMVAISGLGAWIIYRSAPHDTKTLGDPLGYYSQRWPRKLFVMLLPTALTAAVVLFLAQAPAGWILLAVGGILLPIGVASTRYDGRISNIDTDFSTFLRVLGSTASAIGTTPTEALDRVDLRPVATLAPAAKRLHGRLKARVAPQRCWQEFVAELGSELVHRGVRVFLDGVTLGGDANEVGTRAALLSTKVSFMRGKRKMISSSFAWLSLAMHVTTVFLLLFVVDIVGGFGKMVQTAGMADMAMGRGSAGSVMSFSFSNMQFIHGLMVPVVVVLSVVNAVAPKVADGGYSHKIFLYLGLTLVTSGINLILVPKLAGSIFSMAL